MKKFFRLGELTRRARTRSQDECPLLLRWTTPRPQVDLPAVGMEAFASILGIADVTARATLKIWQLCDSWREAPKDVHDLRDNLAAAQEFYVLVKQAADGGNRAVARSTPQSPPIGLIQQLHRGQSILRELEHIITEVSEGRLPDVPGQESLSGSAKPLKKRRRLAWMVKADRVNRLKASLMLNKGMICAELAAMNVAISSELISVAEVSKTTILDNISREFQATSDRIVGRIDGSLRRSTTQIIAKLDSRLAQGLSLSQTAGGSNQGNSTVGSELNNIDAIAKNVAALVSSRMDAQFKDFENRFVELLSRCVPVISSTWPVDRFLPQETSQLTNQRRLESLPSSTVDKPSGSNQISASLTQSTTRTFNFLSRRVHSVCCWDCRCQCHMLKSYREWRITSFRKSLGYLSISYTGFPKQSMPCTDSSCNEAPGSKWAIVHYSFPMWLANIVISACFSSSLESGPEFVLRVSRRVASDSVSVSQSIFGYISRSDYEGAKRLLEKEPMAAIDERGDNGDTPLYVAVGFGDIAMTKLLLQAGAEPFKPGRSGGTAMQVAFNSYLAGETRGIQLMEMPEIYQLLAEYIERCGFSELDKIVLGYMPIKLEDAVRTRRFANQINHQAGEEKRTALDLAVCQGDSHKVGLLLQADANPNLAVSSGRTPLHRAAYGGQHKISELLLENGADVNARDGSSMTPLFLAARSSGGSQPTRFLQLFLDHGAQVNATDEWKCTPLRQAVTRNRAQFVEYLIAQGANVNHQDWEGDTVLLEGIDRRALKSVNILLEKGADCTVLNAYGRGVLHHLAAAGTLDMMRLFKSLGMEGLDPNHADKGGKTPLRILALRHDINLELHTEFQAVLDSMEAFTDDGKTHRGQQESEDSDDEFFDSLESQEEGRLSY